VARDLGDGAASLNRLAGGMGDAANVAVARAAELAALQVRAGLARAVGGDFRMRNAGRVGVRVTIRHQAATIAAVGPVGLLEGPVPAHMIPPGPGGTLAGSLRHPVRGPVRHRGYRARHVWSNATSRAAERAGPAGLEPAGAALVNDYRGG
jgi:hypothetical protein